MSDGAVVRIRKSDGAAVEVILSDPLHLYNIAVDAEPGMADEIMDALERIGCTSISVTDEGECEIPAAPTLPAHRTEAGWPRCATCDGGGCPDCTDPAG